MVDVGGKGESKRRAVASCVLHAQPGTIAAIRAKELPKGDVLAVAQVSGVLAAKRTPDLIPGCHPVRLSALDVTFELDATTVTVTAEARGTDRTGFEMEALSACTVAALTIYDMCKGIDPDMMITNVRLVSKEGGKSSAAARPLEGVQAAVVTVSNGVTQGTREDTGGPAVRDWLKARGATVVSLDVVPDDRASIAATLRELAAGDADVIVTTGGTGVASTDVTPEATLDVAERIVPGLAEAMRTASLRATPHAMISRGVAAILGSSLILNLPGSPKAVAENLDAVQPTLAHAVDLLRGGRPH